MCTGSILAVLLGGAAFAENQKNGNNEEGTYENGKTPRVMLFTCIDTNKDGKIDRAEILAVAEKRFGHYDRNGDGVVTEEDVVAVVEDHSKKMQEVLVGRFQLDKNKEMTKEAFVEEWATHFDNTDKNSDDSLDKKELRGLMRKLHALFKEKRKEAPSCEMLLLGEK